MSESNNSVRGALKEWIRQRIRYKPHELKEQILAIIDSNFNRIDVLLKAVEYVAEMSDQELIELRTSIENFSTDTSETK